MPVDSHRLSILTQHEIDELYGLPRFTDEDRQTCFDLSEPERYAVHSRTTSVAVHLTLQLGYSRQSASFSTTIRTPSMTICSTSLAGISPARTWRPLTCRRTRRDAPCS